MHNKIPLDPKLPSKFDNTDNRARSKAQLDAWWDHPYAVTRENGKIDVRCLNGGAWDRSTWLGQVDTYDEACALAAEKQAAWVRARSRPMTLMDVDGQYLVVMEQRPDQPEIQRLAGPFQTGEEMKAWISANRPDLEERQAGDW
jgi:hypothetical protein